MKICVVIPVLNEAERIARCLESIATQPGEHETIVVDGGSTDRTRELALRRQSFSGLRQDAARR